MMIPDEIVEKVRLTADIVDVVGEHVDLRQKGSNWWGLCPFHDEKTPSFSVSRDKEIYKCFGCGKAGNVFNFMMDFHGMTFPESVENLAGKYHITIPKNKAASTEKSKSGLAKDALESAAHLFSKALTSYEGRQAFEYFMNRGFTEKTIASFGLGYSPDAWNDTMNILKKKGHSEEALLDAGLVIKNEKGRVYDRFRGRAMFPIKDFLGSVIGFGARLIGDAKDQPKYINSPQTPVYDKSRVLFGLFEAKNAIREQESAILVEGYADVLTLHQAGIENVIATSGTALTEGHLEILKRYAKKLYFVYDSDSAGVKAAERGISIALARGFEVFIVNLPEGEDPDSLVRDRGRDEFEKYLKAAINFVQFKKNLAQNEGLLDSAGGIADTLRSVVEIISSVPDQLQHDFYIKSTARVFDLDEFQIQKLYREKSRISSKKFQKPKRFFEENDEQEEVKENLAAKIFPEEKLLLRVYISNPAENHKLFEKFELSDSDFISDGGKEIFSLIVENIEEDNIIHKMMNDEDISPAVRDAIGELSMNSEEVSKNWRLIHKIDTDTVNIEKIITDCKNKLEYRKIESELHFYKTKLSSAADSLKLKILMTMQELTKKKNELSLKIFT